MVLRRYTYVGYRDTTSCILMEERVRCIVNEDFNPEVLSETFRGVTI